MVISADHGPYGRLCSYVAQGACLSKPGTGGEPSRAITDRGWPLSYLLLTIGYFSAFSVLSVAENHSPFKISLENSCTV